MIVADSGLYVSQGAETSGMDRSITLLSDTLESIDAKLSIGTIDGRVGLIVEARGGTFNRDYTFAVATVIGRLQRVGVAMIEAFLVAGVRGAVAVPPLSDRRILIDGRVGIDLVVRDPDGLRLEIGRAVAEQRRTGATGSGNATKRIFLVVSEFDESDWVSALDRTVIVAADGPPSVPDSSGRERTLAAITVRRGQSAFRKRLLVAYGGRCAVTGTTLEAVLEAAHIRSYDGAHTNVVENGLLLRADVHTLFDLYLLGVSKEYRVIAGRPLVGDEYGALDGRSIRLPSLASERPRRSSLAERIAEMERLGLA